MFLGNSVATAGGPFSHFPPRAQRYLPQLFP
jgi:hypothetical protein